jgi:nucleoside-diphosphate-sugar epimerase
VQNQGRDIELLEVFGEVGLGKGLDATIAALDCTPGAYNIVDDDPSQQRVWLPAFARACGAPEPRQITEQEALATAGADSVYYATCLRGASNEKARHELNFRPRPLEWLQP